MKTFQGLSSVVLAKGALLIDTAGTDGTICIPASEIDMDNLPLVKAAWRRLGGRVLAVIRPKLRLNSKFTDHRVKYGTLTLR